MLAQGDRPISQPLLPCVWMSAGLVAFKLCDREGECEGCPFDRAMQGARSEPPALSSPPLHAVSAPAFPIPPYGASAGGSL